MQPASVRRLPVWIVALSSALWSGGASAFEPMGSFPLAGGNAWTYDAGGVLGTIEVQPEPEYIEAELAWLLAPREDIFLNTGEYLTNDASGFRYHGVQVQFGFSTAVFAFDPPILLSPASTQIPSTHPSSGDAIRRVSGTHFVLSYDATSRLVSMETAVVPAGTFSALRMQLDLTIYGNLPVQPLPPLTSAGTLWFAEGVGKVKESSRFDGNTIQAELVSYVLVPEPGVGERTAAIIVGLGALSLRRAGRRPANLRSARTAFGSRRGRMLERVQLPSPFGRKVAAIGAGFVLSTAPRGPDASSVWSKWTKTVPSSNSTLRPSTWSEMRSLRPKRFFIASRCSRFMTQTRFSSSRFRAS